MKYSIIYSSRTGNTRLLAEKIKESIPGGVSYFGAADAAALDANLIFVGFWTDKGCCDDIIADFLKQITTQKVFLFGTAGFGASDDYFDKILAKVKDCLKNPQNVVGQFMCQGKMPASVLARYQNMEESHLKHLLIDNFNKALTHPDNDDMIKLANAVKKVLSL